MSYFVIIPASGSGKRFTGRIPKQFIKINGREILSHTISEFELTPEIKFILISTQKRFFDRMIKIAFENNFTKIYKIVEGGERRMDSVYNALMNLNCKKDDFIIIHDAVRPFVSRKLISRLIKESRKNRAVIPGILISDTVKRTDKNHFVKNTIPRENLFAIQTPQVFRYDILVKSFEKAYRDNYIGTDEAAIVEYSGYKIKLIEGEESNIKITEKKDLRYFKNYMIKSK